MQGRAVGHVCARLKDIAVLVPQACSCFRMYCLAMLTHQPRVCEVQAANSGLVINTMGWVTDLGLDLLYQAIRVLKVDIILVLGDDKLYNTLHQHCRCRL